MHQVVRPGAPFIFGACLSKLDMSTMLFPYGSPERRLSDLTMAELSRYYGVPVFGTAGASDSKIVDAQTDLEYMGSLLIASLAGTNLIHDVGYLESGLTGSLESIITGADAIRWAKQFNAGMKVSDELLALDVIDEVGPAGTFLSHDHTLLHLREDMWLPLIMNHDNYDTWAAKGGKDYVTVSRERACELIDSHQPEPVQTDVDAKLKKILSQ
jgi:trimethylamine--corrinoid protein Co-methyltransferase